ncbi:hypothetical protein ACHHYP_14533 [Achlya hypogyna]|uniref:WRKY19-like zinc finger domain-containing protein n=1 Tax=Achlya hypogyna TaxID=1202772 RepID=A0A1V9YCZ7_ACHHY|nr:hypothetical protein ACHHYP_14533 [Achlya hypogyna]
MLPAPTLPPLRLLPSLASYLPLGDPTTPSPTSRDTFALGFNAGYLRLLTQSPSMKDCLSSRAPAGCTSTAQSKGVCKVHGGRVACRAPGCKKNNQGGGFCRAHGGGQRCKFNGGGHCPKWAQRQSMCIAHSKLAQP